MNNLLNGTSDSNACLPADMRNAQDFLWGTGSTRKVPVTQLRAYSTGTSPQVFFANNYPSSAPVAGTPAPGNQVAAYTPSNTAFATLNTNQTYAVEAVCSIPHGFRTGDHITLATADNKPITVTITNGRNGTVQAQFAPGDQPGTCLVTGSNTIVIIAVWSTLNTWESKAVHTLASSYSPATGYLWLKPTNDIGTIPYEVCAGVAAAASNCSGWYNLPIHVADDAAKLAATKVLSQTPRGRPVYLELSNEPWGFAQASTFDTLMSFVTAGSTGLLKGQNAAWYTFRAGQVRQIWSQIWQAAGRPDSDIILVLGSQMFGPNVTQAYIQAANTWNAAHPTQPIPVGMIAVADYITIQNGPASISSLQGPAMFATDKRSHAAANPTQFAQYVANPLSVASYFDWLRYQRKYTMQLESLIAQHKAAIAAYVPPPGYGMPLFGAYEGGTQNYVRVTISDFQAVRASASLYYAAQHDIFYHPLIRGLELAELQWGQEHGFNLVVPFQLSSPPGWGIWWSFAGHGGQLPGRGDGSDGKAINKFCTTAFGGDGAVHHLGNVSPRLQALLDWGAINAN
jgi:hypothetical protein